jgi:hypothetical protein
VTGWHADEATLLRYARGRGRLSVDASIEAHLLSCALCRAALSRMVESDRLEPLWRDVERRLDAPPPDVGQRLLRLVGVPEDTARLLAATPALRACWLLAVAVTLAFAVLAASAVDWHDRDTLLFLAAAPVLPVAGVATAFRRGLDPTYDIALATPYSQLRLLLLRSAAVTAVTCATALVVGLLLPGRALTAAAWLLPALALTSLTLALARRMDVVWAAAGVGALWLAVLVSSQVRLGQFAVFGAAGQGACLAVAAVSLIVIVADRNNRYATRIGGV